MDKDREKGMGERRGEVRERKIRERMVRKLKKRGKEQWHLKGKFKGQR